MNEYAKIDYNEKKERELYQEELKKLNKEKETQIKFISEFIEYCNNQNTYYAYKMISDTLKATEYNKINEFKNKFIIVYFNKERKTKVNQYEKDIYEVELYNDILESGERKEKQFIKIKLQYENNNIKIIKLGENI